MYKWPILKALGATLTLLMIYLAFAFLWAWNCIPKALESYPSSASAALSGRQQNILLTVEDPSFKTNAGIDIFTPGQGKTTLWQSAVPFLLFENNSPMLMGISQNLFRFVWRNFRKVDFGRDVMALALARQAPSERILDLFVNRVYMGDLKGESVRGLPRASEVFFGKTITELSEDEFIRLVALIKAPHSNKQDLEERTRRIKALLANQCKPQGLFDNDFAGCSL